MNRLALAAAFTAATALAGCGKLGDLERPGPLYGADRATSQKADEVNRQVQDPSRPVDTIDPRQRSADPAPPRTLPIEGGPSDPSKVGPQGALPDPYANPQ
ncbi:hypothetical protein [Phenylobacterium sp.]|uniref:hypothetical protein n=1 Tax=Phenylobacterium sp. TaxID=1871053 RepID=UPI0027339C44|nr:hypothetical protein [Phenylobacterium sp.]MDP3658800.1 hypothetical protein [Phenylobacterium sp.]